MCTTTTPILAAMPSPTPTQAKPAQLVLASQSPRRRELLQLCGFPYTTCAIDLDEEAYVPKNHQWDLPSCKTALQSLAAAKADLALTLQLTSDSSKAYYILGCDTVLWFQNAVLGKPDSPSHACEMLRALRSQTHLVLTACALIGPDGRRLTSFVNETAVTFGPISDAWIEAYVQTGSPLDKAGSYGIQDAGALLVERIDGDYYSVMGLPVAQLYPVLCNYMGEAPLPNGRNSISGQPIILESATATPPKP